MIFTKLPFFVSFDKEVLAKKFKLDVSGEAAGMVFMLEDGDFSLWLPHENFGLNVSDADHECYHIADLSLIELVRLFRKIQAMSI